MLLCSGLPSWDFGWSNSLVLNQNKPVTVQSWLQQGLRDFKNWPTQFPCRAEPRGANSLHKRCSIQTTSTRWDLFMSCWKQKLFRLFTKILIFIRPFKNQSLINLDYKLKEIFVSNAGWNQLASWDIFIHILCRDNDLKCCNINDKAGSWGM